jgi:ABC-type lipoprotein release transport system permease subunit
VVGIFYTGSPLDESLTYTFLETARRFYDVSDVINGISVRLSDFNRDREVAAEIKKRVIRQKAGQKQILQSFKQSLSKALRITSFLASLSLLLLLALSVP